MESALYGIYALVVFVSKILLVRCAHSFDLWYVNNSCVNTRTPALSMKYALFIEYVNSNTYALLDGITVQLQETTHH